MRLIRCCIFLNFIFLNVSVSSKEKQTHPFIIHAGFAQYKSENPVTKGHIPPTKFSDLRIDIGYKLCRFDFGLYYGIGTKEMYKFENGYHHGVGRNAQSYGFNVNFHFAEYLLNDKLTKFFDIYAASKLGGYYAYGKDNTGAGPLVDYYPSGNLFICYAGLGINSMLFKYVGLFCEYGYEICPAYSYNNQWVLRFGLSFRF